MEARVGCGAARGSSVVGGCGGGGEDVDVVVVVDEVKGVWLGVDERMDFRGDFWRGG